MKMQVISERNDFFEVMNNAWSGASDVCKKICEQNRTDEAMRIIEECFCDGEIPTETALNDFIWFELGDMMHLWEDEEPEEDDEELEDED